MRELVYHFEVVLLYIYSLCGADFMTFAAVDASMLLDVCRAFADADGLGGTCLQAAHASDAFSVVY
jgi:hypothetical protein